MTIGPQDRRDEAPISDIVIYATRLIRGELELAAAEVSRNVKLAIVGLAMIVVAVILMMAALNLLASAAVFAAIQAGVPAPWAPVLVGGVLVLIAAALALWGVSALRPSRLVPVKAAARLRRDAETLKEMMKDDPQT